MNPPRNPIPLRLAILAVLMVSFQITLLGDGFLDDVLKYRFESGSTTQVYVWGVRDSTATDIAIPSHVEYEYTDYDDKDDAGRYKVKRRTCAVKSIGGSAFSGRSKLASIAIPNGVTNIGQSAFQNCSCLSGVTVPDGVISIGKNAFYNCSELSNVTIPSSVRAIEEYTFGYCSGLTSVMIPGSVTNICKYAFNNCTGLESVAIPDSVVGVGDYSFAYCSSLSNVTIGRGLASIGAAAFAGCARLMSFDVDSANACYSSANGLLLSKDETMLIVGVNGDVTIPSGVTNICDSAFAGCFGLTSVAIPDSVTSIGEYAFHRCSVLADVMIPDSVTGLGDCVFLNCGALAKVAIGNGVRSIGDSAFFGCNALASVTIPDSVASIGDKAFWRCSALASVEIGSGVENIGKHAFAECVELASVTISDGVKSMEEGAFMCDTKLAGLTIPKSVVHVESLSLDLSAGSVIRFEGGPPEFSNTYNEFVCNSLWLMEGVYPSACKSDWEAVIDADGYWHGLKMRVCEEYAVRYDANNGSGCVADFTGLVGGSHTVEDVDGLDFSWKAHCFQGWAFAPDGEVAYRAGDSIEPSAEGLTLYGVWATPALTLSAYSADWTSGSITLCCTDADTSGRAHRYTLFYHDAETEVWTIVAGARNVAADANGRILLTDNEFSLRLGGLSPVNYCVMDENDRVSAECVTRTRYGIAAGLGRYDKSKYGPKSPTELVQCRNDAELFAEVMTTEGGVAVADMFTLYDECATVRNVSKTWKIVASRAKPGDTVFFCMGTHGGWMDGTSGGGALSAYDGRYLASSMRKDLEPFKTGGACDGAKVVLILPNCHSEAMVATYQSATSSDNGNILYVAAAASTEENIRLNSNSVYTEFGLFFIKLGLARHQADAQRTLQGVDGDFGNRDGAVDLLECAKYTAALYKGRSDVSPASVQYDIHREMMMSNTIVVSGGVKDAMEPPGDIPYLSLSVLRREKGVLVRFDPYEGAEYAMVWYYPKGNSADAHFLCAAGGVTLRTEDFATDGYRRLYFPLANGTDYIFKAVAIGAGGFGDPREAQETTCGESEMRTVEFDAGGGSVSELEREVAKGSAVGELPIPRNGDYQWLGWFKKENDVETEVDADTLVLKSEVYYAKWKEYDLHHTVELDANGAPISLAPIVVRAWEPVGELPEPQWDGHVFGGWFSERGGHGARLWAYSMVARDATYYACWTTMTQEWLDSHRSVATASFGDMAAAASLTAANGSRTVGECYAFGIDPEDPDDDLKITHFEMGEDGKPVITLNHTEDGSGNSFMPRVKTLGKANLADSDEEWREVPEDGDPAMRFFKVKVDMP